ncbi:MAG TPA: C45 family peptidase, partial [Polyangiaceae bacterium]|nr:C45 family peptidase [Polyangiaceae bacterium]
MDAALGLPIHECSGSPRELGRSQGQAFAARIKDFVAQRLDAFRAYAAEREQPNLLSEFLAAGLRCLQIQQTFHADGYEEQLGIAEAAGVEPHVLYAVSNMTDVRDVVLLPAPAFDEGCTAVLLPPGLTKAGRILVGQTWDLNPVDLDYVVAIHRRPLVGPETWSVTCVGSLSLMGMNAAGIAVGTTNIKTRRSRPGVGYLGVLHRALTCDTFDEAADVIRKAPRAAAHTYWLANADRASEFETDPSEVVTRVLAQGPLVRTNHCLAGEFLAAQGESPLPSSERRLERALSLASEASHTPDSLRRLFADRHDGLLSI